MSRTAFNSDLGDDVISQNEFKLVNEDWAIFTEEELHDENFLQFDQDYGAETISGRGDITYPDEVWEDGNLVQGRCGDFKSVYLNDLDHARTKRFTCHVQTCPKCFRIWARRQAERSGGYLWAFVEQYKRRLNHWVLSPKKFISWEHLDKMLKRFVMRFGKGAQKPDIGGYSCSSLQKRLVETVLSVVRHPFRKRCPICRESQENHSSCSQCHVEYQWYFSPHLHVVTDFKFRRVQSRQYARWEKNNRVIFGEVSHLMTKEELISCLAYEFGHARMILGKQTQVIRYFGGSAKRYYRQEVEIVKEEKGELDFAGRNHVFYKLQDSSWQFDKNLCKVRLTEGKPRFAKNLYGERIPLLTSHYNVKLIPLGTFTPDGQWIRIILPRKQVDRQEEKLAGGDPWLTITHQKQFLEAGVPAVHHSKLKGISE